jgi:hypothetical protein
MDRTARSVDVPFKDQPPTLKFGFRHKKEDVNNAAVASVAI